MAYVVVGKNKNEFVCDFIPKRINENWVFSQDEGYSENAVELPKGSIKKLIGRELTWEDNPVELKEII